MQVQSPFLFVRRRMTRWRGGGGTGGAGFAALAKRRADLRRLEVAARESRVTLVRKYRTGELPDVQRVSVAAFLGPLGAPCLTLTASRTSQW